MKFEKFDIEGTMIPFFGISDSSMEVKFNRVARIASRFNIWKEQMQNYVLQNNSSPTSQEYNLSVAFLIIMSTGIRVGNESSAEGFYSDYKEKGKTVFAHTYGLTTLLPEHVSVKNEIVYFNFTGKKHVQNTFELSSDLSKLVIPVIESGYSTVFNMEEPELTRFVKQHTSKHLSTKDFRTFRANVYAFEFGSTQPKYMSKSERKDRIKDTVEKVSQQLNNTPGVVKSSYVDKRLLDYLFPEELIPKKKHGGLLKLYKL